MQSDLRERRNLPPASTVISPEPHAGWRSGVWEDMNAAEGGKASRFSVLVEGRELLSLPSAVPEATCTADIEM